MLLRVMRSVGLDASIIPLWILLTLSVVRVVVLHRRGLLVVVGGIVVVVLVLRRRVAWRVADWEMLGGRSEVCIRVSCK